MAKKSFLHALSRLFDSAGYLVWVGQLLWLVLLYAESFFETSLGKIVKPDYVLRPDTLPQTVNTSSPSISIAPWLIVLAGIALIVFIAYIVLKSYIPAVRDTSEKVVQKTAEQVVRKVEATHKKHVTKAEHRRLTYRTVFWIKMIISLLPLLLVLCLKDVSPFVPYAAAVIVGAIFSLMAIGFFLLGRLFDSLNLDSRLEGRPKKLNTPSKTHKTEV